MNPTLIVLAAGLGSRFGGPKQVEAIGPNGEFIIDYSIYDALRAGFNRVVFVIRKDMEDVFKKGINRFKSKVDMDFVYQDLFDLPHPYVDSKTRSKPWGTGHAILACKKVVGEPFCVINADDFYGPKSYRMIADLMKNLWNSGDADNHSDEKPSFCLVGYELRNTLSDHGSVSRGICEVDANGYLTRVIERTDVKKNGGDAKFLSSDNEWLPLDGCELVSTNLWGFTPYIFDHLEVLFKDFLDRYVNDEKAEFFIPSAVDRLIQDRIAKVTVLRSDEHWVGVTHKNDKALVKEEISKRISAGDYPEKLWEPT